MNIKPYTLVKTLSLLSLISSPISAVYAAELTEKQALDLATQGYVYGYPLVTMDMTRRVMTNVASPEGTRAPMGQFVNAKTYPAATYRDVTAPNADTLYSTAWVDLSKEPYILSLPDMNNRYYLMPILSAWTNVFTVPGTRTTGTKEQTYAIVGPQWKGTLPQGVKELKAPTNLVWILGRTYCTGTPEDYQAVHELQSKYQLMPLSAYGKPYTPPVNIVDPSIDMKTPVRDQVNALNGKLYFKKLAELMKQNPPAKEDAPMVEKLEKIGIIPGKDFDESKLSPTVVKALDQAVKNGQVAISAQEKNAGVTKNGWMYTTKTGLYGTDYLQRAFITQLGLGANRAQDAVYPSAWDDAQGKKFNGSNRYVIKFAKDQIPPVNGFWSLTLYNDKYFFSENPLNRYTLSPRDQLKYNKDGTLDLYIQHDSPGPDKVSNWLPAPNGEFVLMMRLYWPRETVLDGKWAPPPVTQVQ